MFTAFTAIILLNPGNKNNKKWAHKLYGVFVGFVFTLLGGIFYWVLSIFGDSLSVISIFESVGLIVIVPIFFVAVGLYMMVRSIIDKNVRVGSSADIKTTKRLVNFLQKFSFTFSTKIMPIYQTIVLVIFNSSIILMMIKIKIIYINVILTFFLIFGLFCLFKMIRSLIKANEEFDYYVDKFYLIMGKIGIIIFLLLWFGLLIVFDYFAIKEGNWQSFSFSLIFWLVGGFVAYHNLKKFQSSQKIILFCAK